MNVPISDLKIYRPSLKLYVLDVVVSVVLVAVVGLPIVVGLAIILNKGDLVPRFFPAIFASLLGLTASSKAVKSFRSIALSSHSISGTRFLSAKRTGFRVSDIDIEKSNRRNIFEKLLGQQVIHSTNGEKILFYRRIFPKKIIKEILTTCNLAENT